MAYKKLSAQDLKNTDYAKAIEAVDKERHQARLGSYMIMDGEDYVIDDRIDNKRDARGHLSDGKGKIQGKLPWHPTFSKESPYTTSQHPGGHWLREGDLDIYQPSPDQIKRRNTSGLERYMNNVEPGAELRAPAPYNNTRPVPESAYERYARMPKEEIINRYMREKNRLK